MAKSIKKKPRQTAKRGGIKQAETYRHPEAETPLRPDVGTQPQFKKRKPPQNYKYDSSLSPALDYDGQNPVREQGETLIKKISDLGLRISDCKKDELRKIQSEITEATEQLKRISRPFLNWAGKAERYSFDVPTLPLFVHERLSTKAIVETLHLHKRDKQIDMFDLFGDPQRSVTDQVLKAYEYMDKWTNRMVLGDSLVVMNSLLHYEGLGGQVQMIYIDPPYGVKFGSNFQPFVRKRDVSHNDDDDMTREPEMVKAYRDTWELGLHSYLTYMRDRLLLARELLTPSGSLFVQISDENVHHIREIMDEVFGEENFVSIISYTTTSGFVTKYLSRTGDYLLWYSKKKEILKYHQLFEKKRNPFLDATSKYDQIELTTGEKIPLDENLKEKYLLGEIDGKIFRYGGIDSQGGESKENTPIEFNGKIYYPSSGRRWSAKYPEGMQKLVLAGRIGVLGNRLAYIRYFEDFPLAKIDNMWSEIGGTVQSRSDPKIYVVQTGASIIERCMLMTTDPGDLVLDPTCGSGTTAYVAEQWGRRWITIDTSRVPLALARQRLLTATFPYYQLKEESRGPAGGFVYLRKQNKKGEEVGGIVPHVTLKSIANNEPPAEEVLVDRPEEINKITRVTGPFCFEATIPTPMDMDASTPSRPENERDSAQHDGDLYSSFVERMLEVLRKSPLLHLDGGKVIQFKNVRPPAKTLSLSAEAMVDMPSVILTPNEVRGKNLKSKDSSVASLPQNDNKTQTHVALVFGPENGAVSEKLVFEAAKEAHAKSYSHLYVIGFAIQPHARDLIDKCDQAVGIPATYVQATPDLMMGDLLKNMRSSQIFSVCGLPEIKIKRPAKSGINSATKDAKEAAQYQVELLGLDVFDPITMEVDHRKGDDVPAWFLDTDYNGLCFHVSQAFFPRTSAWENLKKALKGKYEESVWDHLAGTVSAPFEAGENKQIAVKVIDDRGNELLVVKNLSEVKK